MKTASRNFNSTQYGHVDHGRLANIVRMGFSAVLILVVILMSVSLFRLKVSNSNMEAIVDVHNKKVALAFAMRDAIRQRAISIYTMLATDDYFVRDAELLRFYSYAGDYRDRREELVNLGVDDKEREIHNRLEIAANKAQPDNRRTAELLMQDVPDDVINESVKRGLEEQKTLLDLLDELIQLQQKYTFDAVQSNRNDYQFIWIMQLSLGVVIIVVGMIIARVVTQNVRIKSRELSDKNMELSLAYKRAEDATKAKSTFLANMSHEIRTPMTGVLGMLDLLRDTNLVSEQKYFTDTAYNSAEALLKVINDVLDFSKIEAGKVNYEEIPFDIRHLMEEVSGLYAKEVQDKGVELVVHIGNEVPDYVRGDPTRLRQILNNLIGNAIKFTHDGEIFVGLECVDSSSADTNPYLKFEVKDTGIGITESSQKLIFNTFTQADESTTRKFGGTGLGLAISQQMVKLFDGEIGVSSKEGEGSTFWFTANLPSSERRIECREKARFDGLTVFIFARSSGMEKTITSLIEYWGCKVIKNSPNNSGVPSVDLAILDIDYLVTKNITDVYLLRKNIVQAKQMIGLFRMSENDAAWKVKHFHLDASVSRPVRRAPLFEAITLLEGKSKENSRHSADHVKNPRQFNKQTTILLVEDNAVNQQVAVAILQKQGFKVDIAADGLQALTLFKTNQYQVILMDCQMPMMDGFEATRKIREYEAAHNIQRTPIIALTANAQAADRDACLASGMDDFLLKPMRIKAVVDVFRKYLTAEQIADERVTTVGETMNGCINKGERNGEISDHFDIKLLEDLMEVLSKEQFDEVTSLFIKNADDRLNELILFSREEEVKKLESSAHSLKGSSSNLGAKKISSMCATIVEYARRNEKAPNLDGLIAEIAEELGYVNEYFIKKTGQG